VSHIPKFGDAASPAGNGAPIPERCDNWPLEMYHLLETYTSPTRDAAPLARNMSAPAGDVSASSKFGICDAGDLADGGNEKRIRKTEKITDELAQ